MKFKSELLHTIEYKKSAWGDLNYFIYNNVNEQLSEDYYNAAEAVLNNWNDKQDLIKLLQLIEQFATVQKISIYEWNEFVIMFRTSDKLGSYEFALNYEDDELYHFYDEQTELGSSRRLKDLNEAASYLKMRFELEK